MNKLYISDNLFEALFRQVVIDNFNRELAKIPSEEELSKSITFSAQHELRMKKLFIYINRKYWIKSALKQAKKIAVITILTIFILFGALMTMPNVRASVTETFILWFDQNLKSNSSILTSSGSVLGTLGTYKLNVTGTVTRNGVTEKVTDNLEKLLP